MSVFFGAPFFSEFLLRHKRGAFQGPRNITSKKDGRGNFPSFDEVLVRESNTGPGQDIIVLLRVFVKTKEKSFSGADLNQHY